MRFLSAAHTDVGIKKKVNQDSFCLKIASVKTGNIAFAVMCDGMGGLRSGELASSFVVNALSEWFDTELPQIMAEGFNLQKIKNQWEEIVVRQNRLIGDFGKDNGFSLGTTLTALLIYGNDYIAVHVGDSRLYRLTNSITQLTKDHSLVAQKVEQGKITAEQARTDPERNVLLRCVGATSSLTPDFVSGRVSVNDVFMLCSDGFRHEILDEEIYGILAPDILSGEQVIKNSLVDLVELNKARGEKDNITSIVIKCIK